MCFGIATYERGIKKLESATKESEIETDCENVRKKQRRTYENTERAAKKQRTYNNVSDSEEENSCTVLPQLPSLGYEPQNLCETSQRFPNVQSREDSDSGIFFFFF